MVLVTVPVLPTSKFLSATKGATAGPPELIASASGAGVFVGGTGLGVRVGPAPLPTPCPLAVMYSMLNRLPAPPLKTKNTLCDPPGSLTGTVTSVQLCQPPLPGT